MEILFFLAGVACILISRWSDKKDARKAIAQEQGIDPKRVSKFEVKLYEMRNPGSEAAAALLILGGLLAVFSLGFWVIK